MQAVTTMSDADITAVLLCSFLVFFQNIGFAALEVSSSVFCQADKFLTHLGPPCIILAQLPLTQPLGGTGRQVHCMCTSCIKCAVAHTASALAPQMAAASCHCSSSEAPHLLPEQQSHSKPCSWLQNGNVRAKNARAILLKNCIDKLVGGICYWAVGFAFAYGSSSNGFIG